MRERNRRAREYSQRCWERRWNRRLWILNALMILLIIGILLWALTLPEAQEPEDVPPPLPAAVQAAVLSAAKPPENLLLAPYFKTAIRKSQTAWRAVVTTAVRLGIPVPAMSAALAYFDACRSARLPANLLQAQRDYFGAHGYERSDRPRGEFFHTNWTGSGGATLSGSYGV